jgi:hypothetical protein
MRPRDADPTHCHERPGYPADCLSIAGEHGYQPIEEAMATVLNEAGATYPEATAFLAINGSKPLVRRTPASLSNGLSRGCFP